MKRFFVLLCAACAALAACDDKHENVEPAADITVLTLSDDFPWINVGNNDLVEIRTAEELNSYVGAEGRRQLQGIDYSKRTVLAVSLWAQCGISDVKSSYSVAGGVPQFKVDMDVDSSRTSGRWNIAALVPALADSVTVDFSINVFQPAVAQPDTSKVTH